MSRHDVQNPEHGDQLVTQERVRTRKPRRYKVLLHNDDYTSMDFVVYILKKFFHKSEEQANTIMLQVHHEGVGVAGVFTYDVAETKIALVEGEARDQGMPLMCSLEAE